MKHSLNVQVSVHFYFISQKKTTIIILIVKYLKVTDI